MFSASLKYFDFNPQGWKAEWARLADSQRTLYPQSGHMSTIDQA